MKFNIKTFFWLIIAALTIEVESFQYVFSNAAYAESYGSDGVIVGKRFQGRRKKRRAPRRRPHNHNHQAPKQNNPDPKAPNNHDHQSHVNPMPDSHQCKPESFDFKVEETGNITQIVIPNSKVTFSIDDNGNLKAVDQTTIQPYRAEAAKTICAFYEDQRKQGKLISENIKKFMTACENLSLATPLKVEQGTTPHLSPPSPIFDPKPEAHQPPPVEQTPQFSRPYLPPSITPSQPPKDDCCPDEKKAPSKKKKDDCCPGH
jgi:hypothetical protein